MTQYIVTEIDSDGDLVTATGPFAIREQAVSWLHNVRAPAFAANWQEQLGPELDVKTEFHPSGCRIHVDCDPQSFNIVALQEPEAV